MVIRRATARDLVPMAVAHARSWRATYSGLLPEAVIDEVVASQPARVERWRARLADPRELGPVLVAEIDHRLVGVAFWGPAQGPEARPDTAEVQAIYLDPDAIGRGIGRALFAATVGEIVGGGFTRAFLWVLETNDRARRFYEAAGWRPDGGTKTVERPGGAIHEVRYSRTLQEPGVA